MSDLIVTQTQAPSSLDLEKQVDDARDYCDSIWGLIQEYQGQPEQLRLEAVYDQSLSNWIHSRLDQRNGNTNLSPKGE